MGRRQRFMSRFQRLALGTAVLVSAVVAVSLISSFLAPSAPEHPTGETTKISGQFSYGFDFAQSGPYAAAGPGANAAASARHVISSMPGIVEDIPIMGWGMPDPEPAPGRFDLSAIAKRVRLVISTGGVPVVTLCVAPDWMTPGFLEPPTPAHYQDFATLAAKIARSFPRVRYFVVWNEFKGFWNKAASRWNIQGYTTMYNDVYRAIKRVRPAAQVGGPYAVTPPLAGPGPGNLPSTPHGPWGYLFQGTLDAIRYWLTHKVGADFIALDGRDFPGAHLITSPLIATEKYAALDAWVKRITSLPIWWMESHIQPANSGWSESRAAAIRVAALIQMAASGARVGMQWQPQQGGGVPDEGVWTATDFPGGGRPTALGRILPGVQSVLRHKVTIVAGQAPGVLVASGPGGAIAVNTTAGSARARVDGATILLRPGQVRVSRGGRGS